MANPELLKILTIINKLSYKVLVDNPEEFVKNTMVLPVIDEKSGIKIDFIFSFSEYGKVAISSSISVKIGRSWVKISSIEDLTKLLQEVSIFYKVEMKCL